MARSFGAGGFSDSGLRRVPRAQGMAGVASVLAARTDFIQRGVFVIAAILLVCCSWPDINLHLQCGGVLAAIWAFSGRPWG